MWYRRLDDLRVDGGTFIDHPGALGAPRVQLRLPLLGVDRLADLVRVRCKLGCLLVDVDVVEFWQLLVDLGADLGELRVPGDDECLLVFQLAPRRLQGDLVLLGGLGCGEVVLLSGQAEAVLHLVLAGEADLLHDLGHPLLEGARKRLAGHAEQAEARGMLVHIGNRRTGEFPKGRPMQCEIRR